MELLLDTHSLIWYFEGNNKLSKNALNLIESIDNDVYIVILSLSVIARHIKKFFFIFIN